MFTCITCAEPTPIGARFPGGRCACCYVDLVYDLQRLEGAAGDFPISTPWMPL